MLHRGAADLETVGIVLAAPGGGIDDQVHRSGCDHIQNIGVGLGDPGHLTGGHARGVERVAGTAGGQDLDLHIRKAPGDAHDLPRP